MSSPVMLSRDDGGVVKEILVLESVSAASAIRRTHPLVPQS